MNAGERMHATYRFQPVDHLFRREFYIWDEAIARWKEEGLPKDYRERNLFCFDPPGQVKVGLDLLTFARQKKRTRLPEVQQARRFLDGRCFFVRCKGQ